MTAGVSIRDVRVEDLAAITEIYDARLGTTTHEWATWGTERPPRFSGTALFRTVRTTQYH